MNERMEQIKAVMADEAFVKTCAEAENAEAVQKLLADKGVEMSLGEIELMGEMLGAVTEGKVTQEQIEKLANIGELSEEELEEAAGGIEIDFLGDNYDWRILTRHMGTDRETQYIVGGNTYQLGKVGVIVAAIGTVALAGYGVYDAIRRRW